MLKSSSESGVGKVDDTAITYEDALPDKVLSRLMNMQTSDITILGNDSLEGEKLIQYSAPFYPSVYTFWVTKDGNPFVRGITRKAEDQYCSAITAILFTQLGGK